MRVEIAKQSNHTSFIVPAEMGSVTYSSLHQYVAKWMLSHQRFVCCDDVAHAFGISRRQASNIIYSIHSRHGDIYRHSMKRIKEGKGNVIKTWLKIEAIEASEKKAAPVKSTARKSKKAGDTINSMASLFLSRKPGATAWAHG